MPPSKGRFDVSVFGDEVAARLQALPDAVERRLLSRALREGGKVVLPVARSLTPVRSGRLRRSLKLRAMRRKKGRVGVLIFTGTREELQISGKDPYYYPTAVELGTSKRRARPYLRPALFRTREQATEVIGQVLWAGIVRETARAAARASGDTRRAIDLG
jgi:HK97 gp10 family phage protein